MASVTLKVSEFFAPSTSVGAYPRSQWSTGSPPATGTAPPGSATATATVASDGSLAFTGLTPNTEYVAGASPWSRYINFFAPSGGYGLLADRPAIGSVPDGTEYFATDDVGGTEYTAQSGAWVTTGGKGTELGYAEVTSTQTSSSTTYADVTNLTITVTSRGRPFMVIASVNASPSNNTASDGGKYNIVRTDTSTSIAESAWRNSIAVGPGSLPPLRRRVNVAAGTTITFKVQIAAVTGGTATFGATTDLPLTLQAIEC
jgi:hypothetical protein